jgi:hypothetical protein
MINLMIKQGRQSDELSLVGAQDLASGALFAKYEGEPEVSRCAL